VLPGVCCLWKWTIKLTEANAAIRAQNVTASEVGALLAPHPYMTPERIWDRLVSPLPMSVVVSEAMDTGSFMEAAILRLAEKRLGIRARQNAKTYTHKTVHLCATPDALVLGSTLIGPEPVPELVEVKLSGRPEMWREVPIHVEWQVRAQMACTGRSTTAVCVLVGAGLRTFIVERDALLEAELLEAVDRFWEINVVGLQRPLPIPKSEELVMRIQ